MNPEANTPATVIPLPTKKKPAARRPTRRGNGEGTVVEEPERNRWVARVSVNGVRKKFIGRTRQEALDKMNDWRLRTGNLKAGSRPETVAELLALWSPWARNPHRKNPIKAETWTSTYESKIRNHLLPALGHLSLDKLTPSKVTTALTDREAMTGSGLKGEATKAGKVLSARSVQMVYGILSSALAWGVSEKFIASNPLEGERPNGASPEKVTWTPAEVSQFLVEAETSNHAVLFHLGARTGARLGELLALRKQDVDLEKATLSISASLHRKKMNVRGPCKTKNSVRTISLDSATVELLKSHLASCAGDWLFATGTGNTLSRPNVSREFDLIQERAGLPETSFHTLRHAHTTQLLHAGVPLPQVAARLGDTQQTILATYSHILPSISAVTTGALDALLKE